MTNEAKQKDLSAEVEELQRRLSAIEARYRNLAEVLQQPALVFPFPTVWKDYPAAWEFWWQLHVAGGGAEGPKEISVPGWEHLVIRRHPWRRQLYLKGRNMTVRQLVGTVKANGWSEAEAADNLELPLGAIREALRYAEENQALLDFEAAYERLILARKGYSRGVPPVP